MNVLPVISCATCVGQDGQVTTLAANGAVYVMLGCLALVGLAVLAIVFAFVRRARRFAAASSDTSAPL